MAILPTSFDASSTSSLVPRVCFSTEQLVAGGVDARDEEAGDRRQPVEAAARGDAIVEAGEVRVGHRLVLRQREDQGDVHAHALRGQRAHRGDPLGRGRDLDHDVGPPDQVRQAQTLGDGLLGVGGKLGQHLQRDAPVDAARRLEDRQHHVAAAADVVEHELLVDRLRGLPIGDQALQLVLVVGGAGDRLLEDRRVRRHPAHALVAERAQPAACGRGRG